MKSSLESICRICREELDEGENESVACDKCGYMVSCGYAKVDYDPDYEISEDNKGYMCYYCLREDPDGECRSVSVREAMHINLIDHYDSTFNLQENVPPKCCGDDYHRIYFYCDVCRRFIGCNFVVFEGISKLTPHKTALGSTSWHPSDKTYCSSCFERNGSLFNIHLKDLNLRTLKNNKMVYFKNNSDFTIYIN